MVALEAAERGRAAIVTDVGGLPEIVEDGETGLVVPAGGRDALAAAIVALASDHERVRRSARPHARGRSPTSPPAPQPTASRPSTADCSRCTSRPGTGGADERSRGRLVPRRAPARRSRLARVRVAAAATARRVRRHAAAAAAHAASGEDDERLARAGASRAGAGTARAPHALGRPDTGAPAGRGRRGCRGARGGCVASRARPRAAASSAAAAGTSTAGLAETLAAFGYVDCTATTFRQQYLDEGCAAAAAAPHRRRLRLPSGASLLELPATHSLGMLARGLHRLPALVHLHFHDWELVDRRRAARAGRAAAPARRPPPAAPRSTSSPSGPPRPRNWPGRRLRSARDDGPEDVRATKPYLFSRSPLKTFVQAPREHRSRSFTIDIAGLVLGLYAALALRSLVFDPKPILWGLLWDHETRLARVPDPAARPRLLARRALRAARDARGRRPRRAERVPRRGARARVRDRHRPALHDVRPLRRRRALRRGPDRRLPRELRDGDGDRCCAPPACAARSCSSATTTQRAHLRAIARREPRRHRLRLRRRGRARVRASRTRSHESRSTRLIVADTGLDEPRLLEIVDARPPPRRQGARRAAHDRAADRARRVRAGSGRAAVRAAPADLRRSAVGDEARRSTSSSAR